ncbi:MAG: Ribosomal RNA small subunit methyltransferase B [Legionellaceae bacterium]
MNSRFIAAQIITAVIKDNISLKEAIGRYTTVTTPQLHLIKELCYGTLRFFPRLQAICKALLTKSIKPKDKMIEVIITIGLYQLLNMRTPEHAAVSETVDAAKKTHKTWAPIFVNAILRNFQRNKETLLEKLHENPESETLHPEWLLNKIQLVWPHHWQKIITANNQHSPLTLRINEQKQSRDKYLTLLKAEDINAEKTLFSPQGLILENPTEIKKIPGFDKGCVSVQDLGAQLAAQLLAVEPQQRVLDACAAPGGKTAHILELQPNLKELIAIDKDGKRLNKVKENLSRLTLSATLIECDAAETAKWWDGILFDRILIDAPCSATGVIRRHPDIKYLRRESDFTTLHEQQTKLLNALWTLLIPGGILVYSTCSIMPEENTQTISKFLATHENAEEIPIIADWGIKLNPGRQILPGQDNMDGFYYAVIRKND